jgi:hypothetical protein
MKYSIIQPPFTLNFRNMARVEANNYFNWFMDQLPIRIHELESAVQSVPSYENWRADFTLASLEKLGQFFYEHVETRKRTEEEVAAIYKEAPDWFRNVEVEDWELTNRSFSLAIDIGMYLSQVFEKNLVGLEWTLVKKPKNDINYQQPVLKGAGKLVFNPVHIATTLAYGFARQNKSPERLREIYGNWANLLMN